MPLRTLDEAIVGQLNLRPCHLYIKVEPAPTDIHEPAWRRESTGITPDARPLVHRAGKRQRHEDAENGQGQAIRAPSLRQDDS